MVLNLEHCGSYWHICKHTHVVAAVNLSSVLSGDWQQSLWCLLPTHLRTSPKRGPPGAEGHKGGGYGYGCGGLVCDYLCLMG